MSRNRVAKVFVKTAIRYLLLNNEEFEGEKRRWADEGWDWTPLYMTVPVDLRVPILIIKVSPKAAKTGENYYVGVRIQSSIDDDDTFDRFLGEPE